MAHPGTIVIAPGIGAPSNDWGVEVHALADQARTHASQTYHGVAIGGGLDDSGGLSGGPISPIGRITSWNPQVYQRELVNSWELSVTTFGKSVDITPGRNTTYECTQTRVEVWQLEMEVAYGLTSTDEVFEDLMDQDRPFRVDEVLMRNTSLYRHWRYLGCWFKDMGSPEFSAEGSDTRIQRSGAFGFVRRSRST